MKLSLSFITVAGTALVAMPALAQTAPTTAPQTAPGAASQTASAPQSTPAPAATATPAAGATVTTTTTAAAPVTDAEVQQFARAALDVEEVRADATIPAADKNARYVAAIQASGLKAVRFNEIATAMQSDEALNQRIQKAGMALTASADAAAGATADSGADTGTATTDE